MQRKFGRVVLKKRKITDKSNTNNSLQTLIDENEEFEQETDKANAQDSSISLSSKIFQHFISTQFIENDKENAGGDR